MLKKDEETLDTNKVTRYGLRKLSIGLTGAAIGAFLALGNPATQTVKADTVPDDPDQVNIEPSGEQAAKQELAKAQENTTPVKAAANQASAKLAAKSSAVKVAPTKTTAQAQTVSKQNTQNKENNSQTTNEQAVNTTKPVAKKTTKKIAKKAKRAKTTRKAKKAVKTKYIGKKTSKLVGKTAFSSIATKDYDFDDNTDDDNVLDPAHTKTVQRKVSWYTVDKSGKKTPLTSITQKIHFGQQWQEINDGGKEYIPWEQDTRRRSFKAYTNTDLLKNLQDQVNAGNMTQTDYNSINNIFKNGTVSSDGAPAVNQIGPLSQDLTYEIDITTEEKVSVVNVSVLYVDLDSNNAVIGQNSYQASPGGQVKGQDDYKQTMSTLTSKGYKYDPANENLPSGYKKLPNQGLINLPAAADSDQTNFTYYVGLHHDVRIYNPGENNPFTGKNDDTNLVKNVTQTIKYVGASVNPPDNVQTIKFSRKGQVDMVTGDTKYLDWDKTSDQYKDVTSPAVDGYTPDQDVIKGSQVTPNSTDTTKTVTYATGDQLRNAIVHYRYDSWDSNKEVFPDKNRKVVAKENSSGGLDFDKDTFNQDIIQKDGYTASVMHTNVQGGVIHAWIVYVKNPENNFIVHFIDQDNNNQKIPGVNDVTSSNIIGKPVEKPAGVDDIIKQLQDKGYEVVSDPFENPPTAVNGKQEANYVLKHKKVPVNPVTNRKETVHFVDQDGKQIAPDKTQSASFTHSGVTDLVTGETTWTGWSENKTTDAVDVPVVNGYVATQKQVPSQTLTPDQDIDITVKYNQIGKLIPVDDDGNQIPGASQPSYENDPTDPTKVKPNQKVPDVPGYTPETPTVTPTDPIKNTPVKYHKAKTPAKDQTSLGVVVHDDDTGQDLNDYHWTSGSVNPGDKVDYNWNKAKQDLIDHGYVIVQEPNIPDRYGQSAQIVTVHVKHGIVHVNPDNPQTAGGKINKGNATWPDTSQYQHDRKYTVHFVDSNGKQIAKDEVQTMRFGRDLQIDAVTGKILNPDAPWTPQNKEYAGVSADKINGYKANAKSKNGVALVNGTLPGPNAVDSDITDSIVYTADDQVPDNPNDNNIEPEKPNNNLGNPSKPAKPAAPAKKAPAAAPAKAAAQPQVNKSSVLPQTSSDSKQELALSILGITMMLLTLGKSPLKRKH